MFPHVPPRPTSARRSGRCAARASMFPTCSPRWPRNLLLFPCVLLTELPESQKPVKTNCFFHSKRKSQLDTENNSQKSCARCDGQRVSCKNGNVKPSPCHSTITTPELDPACPVDRLPDLQKKKIRRTALCSSFACPFAYRPSISRRSSPYFPHMFPLWCSVFGLSFHPSSNKLALAFLPTQLSEQASQFVPRVHHMRWCLRLVLFERPSCARSDIQSYCRTLRTTCQPSAVPRCCCCAPHLPCKTTRSHLLVRDGTN